MSGKKHGVPDAKGKGGGTRKVFYPVTPTTFAATHKVFNAEMFTPHQFTNTRYIMKHGGFIRPHVIIAQEALADMYYIAGHAGYNEVGWLGTVERIDDALRITEIFLFEQQVSASSTELDQEHIAQVATELIQAGHMDKVNALKFWGHVHPSNSTSPSATDNETMLMFEDGNEWFLRGIFGRNGRAEFCLFDYNRGIVFQDIPWVMENPKFEERGERILDMVTRMVRSTYATYVQPHFPHTRKTPFVVPISSDGDDDVIANEGEDVIVSEGEDGQVSEI